MKNKKINITRFIKDTVKAVVRLSLNEQRLSVQHENFKEIIGKIESKRPSIFTVKQKEALSDYYTEVMFCKGKIHAYWFLLVSILGRERAEDLIFKGVRGERNIDKYGNKIKKK